jgi:TetR/AcrR family transcriptional repressor of nem operon
MPRLPNPKAREKLLDAAERTMLRKGFEAASLDDICQAAGLTKGSFFHYFRNKNQVAAEAVKRFYQRGREMFRTAPYQKLADPLKRVHGFLDLVARIGVDGKMADGCLIGIVAQEMSATNPELRRTCADCFSEWATGLAADLELAKAKHAPRAKWNARTLADHFIAVFEGALILMKSKQDSRALPESAAHLKRYVTLLFDGKR